MGVILATYCFLTWCLHLREEKRFILVRPYVLTIRNTMIFQLEMLLCLCFPWRKKIHSPTQVYAKSLHFSVWCAKCRLVRLNHRASFFLLPLKKVLIREMKIRKQIRTKETTKIFDKW